jgi:molecular chaperone GrpE
MTEENRENSTADEQLEEQESTDETVLEPEGEAQAEGELEKEEPEEDDLTRLSRQLEETQAKSEEYLDGWQRSRAEFANYRRREEQRRKQLNAQAQSALLSHLLPVLDDLDRAFQMIPEDARESGWVEGLSLVGHKLQTALEKEGLSIMQVQAGDAFDPNYHEAVTHEPSDECGAGQIIEILQRGYTLDGVVLRPALVRVSCGKLDVED